MVDLDDVEQIQRADRSGVLLRSAYAGAVLRRGWASAGEAGVTAAEPGSLRSIVIAAAPRLRGTAELIATLIAPLAPAPVVVTTTLDHGHRWLSAADLVAVLSATGGEEGCLQALSAAQSRGSDAVVAAPPSSAIAESARTARVPLIGWPAPDATDVQWTALAVLLRVCGIAHRELDRLVDDLDQTGAQLAPAVATSANPAKQVAAALAGPGVLIVSTDDLSGAVAAGLAESVLMTSGTVVGQADLRTVAGAIERLLDEGVSSDADIFHDPFLDSEDGPPAPALRLVLLAHGPEDDAQTAMIEHAARRGVTMVMLEPAGQDPLARACQLVLAGQLAAGYTSVAASGR